MSDKAALDNYLFLLAARDKVRGFLKENGYLEVLIPTLFPETVPDINLESFVVTFQSVFYRRHKARLFLQTSPELLLKRMLASGFEAIFYLGPVFRQGEFAEKHHPEFTMAEWYRTGYSYSNLMSEMERMLATLFNIKHPIPRITMREAMIQASGIDFLKTQTSRQLAAEIKRRIKHFDPKGMDYCDLLEFAMVEWLDQWLADKPAIFIYDWPSQFSMQAKLNPKDKRLCERFELYMRGLEIANGYTEATDSAEMELRLRAEIKKRKKLGRKVTPMPVRFLQSLDRGFPACAGVSLGLERLCMGLLGLHNLDQLIAFREI